MWEKTILQKKEEYLVFFSDDSTSRMQFETWLERVLRNAKIGLYFRNLERGLRKKNIICHSLKVMLGYAWLAESA